MDLQEIVEWWGTSCLDGMNNANSDVQALLNFSEPDVVTDYFPRCSVGQYSAFACQMSSELANTA